MSETELIQIDTTVSIQDKRLTASDVLRVVDYVKNTRTAGNAFEIDLISLSRLFINANAFVENVIGSTHRNCHLFIKTGVLCS